MSHDSEVSRDELRALEDVSAMLSTTAELAGVVIDYNGRDGRTVSLAHACALLTQQAKAALDAVIGAQMKRIASSRRGEHQ